MAKQKKIVVICGEKSGEMHAAKVCIELFKSDPTLKIIGWGGDEMKKAGVEVKRHISTLAMMGFWEVLKRIFFVKKLFGECKEMIFEINPDLILFVDYSGFNLRIGKWASQSGYLNHYFIPPKTWAWNQKRTYKLRDFFQKVYTILPFEKSFFNNYGVETYYVGNPILETIEQNAVTSKPNQESTLVALIPGSRASEISRMLPELCKLKANFPEFNFVISGVSSVEKSLYDVAKAYNIPVRFSAFYDILSIADYAVVTSGTATLETAMLNVPQIVVFKTSWVTYLIARIFVRVKYISLVNLIADEEVVEELIQKRFTVNQLKSSLKSLIKNREIILQKYEKVRVEIGQKNASLEVSKHIIKDLNAEIV